VIRLFSKRHERAIFEKKLRVSLPRRLRQRIWALLQKSNHSYAYQPDPHDRWIENSDIITEVGAELPRRYGVEKLEAFNDNDERVGVDLRGFVRGAYPSQVLDTVELFYSYLDGDFRLGFQAELNDILEEEGAEWRLTDGQFFKVDPAFLSLQVVAPTYELLKAEGFEGALDEFNEARNDLTAGDFKGAVHNSAKAFESVLKAILGRPSGTASALIRDLTQSDFCADLPAELRQSFGEQVLMCLPFLRNRLAGHGQGEVVVEVPRPYAELAVHLAGSLLQFSVKRALDLKATPTQRKAPPAPKAEDEIPF